MYSIFAMLSGALVAIMVLMNGNLSAQYGNYQATVIIHLVGLAALIIFMFIKKIGLKKELLRIPWFYYLGGAIGVLTVVFNNFTAISLGVSATLALSLLGQTVTSLIIDEWGLLGAQVRKFNKKKIIGLAFIIAGIVVILMY